MGYDYRTGSSEPGASAPIDRRRDGDERTLAWSLDLYAAAGVPVERTILGLPLYGLAWPVATGRSRRAGDRPGRHLGPAPEPRDARATVTLVPSYDPIEDVAFLAVPDGSALAGGLLRHAAEPDPEARLADDRGLAGAGFWALGYERGLPAYTDLVAEFRAGRLAPAAP